MLVGFFFALFDFLRLFVVPFVTFEM